MEGSSFFFLFAHEQILKEKQFRLHKATSKNGPIISKADYVENLKYAKVNEEQLSHSLKYLILYTDERRFSYTLK